MTAAQLLLPARERLEELYGANRFLDAFRMTESAWADRSLAERLSVSDLIFAGRLAHHLGSDQISRALFRLAGARAPDDAEVLFFCGPPRQRNPSLYKQLRYFEERPQLGGPDPDLNASWCVNHALLLAAARDFENARKRLQDADAIAERSAWTVSSHALVALMELRMDDALAHAELAWEMSPGLPQGVIALSSALNAAGKMQETAERLLDHVEAGGQSYFALGRGLMAAVGSAARHGRQATARLGGRALAMAPQLGLLAPLADRRSQQGFAALRAELALATGDRAGYVRHARASRHPFFVRTADHLEQHPEGSRWTLPYEAVRQQHKTCLPAAIATALSCFGVKVDHDALAFRVTYDGTPWWRAVRWANENGFVTRSFLADPASMRTVLNARLPFVFSVAGFANAHACTAVGVDEGTGTLVVHDPGSAGVSEGFIDGFAELDAPLGLEALVIAPAAEAARVGALLLPNEPEAIALRTWRESLSDRGIDDALEIHRALEAEHPGTATARYLQAAAAQNAGDADHARDLLAALLARWPNSPTLQRSLLGAIGARGSAEERRATLEHILDARPLPGIDGDHAQIHAHPELYVELSELLRASAALEPRAQSLLEKALSMSPQMAAGYHSAGTFLLERGRTAEAILPLRIASLLDPENDFFAQTYASALWRLGRSAEALDGLTARTEKATDAGGGGASALLAEFLEEAGEPERALEVLTRAVERYPTDGILAGMAATTFQRWGQRELADRALETSRAHAAPAVHRRAAINVRIHRGHQKDALSQALEWLEQAPADHEAHIVVAELTRDVEGSAAARALLERWRADRPGDPRLDDLMERVFPADADPKEQAERAAARLGRNPHDLSARATLVEVAMQAMTAADDASLGTLRAEAELELQRALEAQPRAAAFIAMQAELQSVGSDISVAIRRVGEALATAPLNGRALASFQNLASRWPERHKTEVVAIWDRVVASDASSPDVRATALIDLHDRYGLPEAERAHARWSALHPGCPGLAEGWVRLLLDSECSGERARALLPALETLALTRYPHRASLRAALAKTTLRAGHTALGTEMLEALVERFPAHVECWATLAELRLEQGDLARTEELGRRAVSCLPWEPVAHTILIRALSMAEKVDDAESAVATAMAQLADPFSRVGLQTEVLLKQGRVRDAIEVARETSERFPRSASLAFLYAQTLERAHTADSEVEAAYREALARAPGDWDIVAAVFERRCASGHLDEASAVLDGFVKRRGDALTVAGARLQASRLAESVEVPEEPATPASSKHDGERSEPLQQIAELLRAEPNYLYGWYLFVTWARADQAWALVRELLEKRGPLARAHVGVELITLELWEASGLPEDALRERWSKAIETHPRAVELHRARFARLLNAGELAEASRALTSFAAERHRPEVEAWRVQLEMADGDRKAGLEALERLWSGPAVGDVDLDATMSALASARALDSASKWLAELIPKDPPPAEGYRRAMALAAYQAQKHSSLFALVGALARDDLSFDARDELGWAVVMLADLDGAFNLLKLTGRSWEELREHPRLWHAAVRWMRSPAVNPTTSWLTDWRERGDLDQPALHAAAVANAVAGMWGETRDVARFALRERPSRGSDAALTMYAVLASLELNEADAARTDYEAFRHHISGFDEEEPLRIALESVYAALTTDDPAEVTRLHRESAAARAALVWSEFAWETVLRTRLGWWRRLWLKLHG